MGRSITEIVDRVEHLLELPPGSTYDLSRRTRDISLARHVIFYLARREQKLSFKAIGAAFGMNHKSVMYGFNRVSVSVIMREQPFLEILHQLHYDPSLL